jgi:Fe-S cluster assembly protein SufB
MRPLHVFYYICQFMKQENVNMEESREIIREIANEEYKEGFVSNVRQEFAPKGLSEEIIRLISKKKNEPEWLLEFRLKAYAKWKTMKMPTWGHLKVPEIDYQDIIYYAAPSGKPVAGVAGTEAVKSDIDPELEETFNKLGIPLKERNVLQGVAVDAVFDSVSVKTTFRETLAEKGIIFCSFSEAVKDYPDLVRKYLASVVPIGDNYFSALNSAVFSDGSFCYIPKNTRCPMEVSSYFRINASGTGQFERTLIVADEGAYVSYLEGCTAPRRDKAQLHAAVVEIVVKQDAEVKYSTVQNWYPGNKNGDGGIYNLVTKRGLCEGANAKLFWAQVETGSAITWKYPSTILRGDNSTSEFYSVAVTNNWQQADTGTKMLHIGKNTRSRVVSKGISAGHSENSYRGLIRVFPNATGARNYSQCDSLLLGDKCGAHTFPHIDSANKSAVIEHEATTSKIGDDQLFYCRQRGIKAEDAVGLIVNGYAREVLNKLPMEFAVEAQKLLQVSLEGSIG